MSSMQKAIKYGAIAFAVLLIATIVSAVVSGIALIINSNFTDKLIKSNIDHEKYDSYLDINIKYADLKILVGEELKVKNENEKIYVEQDSNKRLIITDSSNPLKKKEASEIVIYIPEDMEYDIVNINSGTGKINVEGFTTRELTLDLGAGKSVIKNITSNKTKINSGAGSLNIIDSKLNDLDLDLGVGAININSSITGNSKIDCGVGSVNLNLDSDDYKFEIDKGVGSITINGTSITSDIKTIGGGNNFIKIDGGIGEIKINTK